MRYWRSFGLALLSLGVALVWWATPVQAASRVPSQFRGTWYTYLLEIEQDQGHTSSHTYEIMKYHFTPTRVYGTLYTTTNPNMRHLKWRSKVQYRVTGTRTHGNYRLRNHQGRSICVLRRRTIKVAGKRTSALQFHVPNANEYGFRTAIQAFRHGTL